MTPAGVTDPIARRASTVRGPGRTPPRRSRGPGVAARLDIRPARGDPGGSAPAPSDSAPPQPGARRARFSALLVSDDPPTRAHWSAHWQATTASVDLHEASTLADAAGHLDTARTHPPHHRIGDRPQVIVLDATLIGPTPADTHRPDPVFAPAQRVVVCGIPTLDRVRAALQAGARGYLFPPPAPPHHPPPPPPVGPPARARPTGAGGAATVPVTAADGTAAHLTAREVQILALVAEGMSNSEIAAVVGVAVLTVKSHLARVSQRLHATDRAHLVLLVLRAAAIR